MVMNCNKELFSYFRKVEKCKSFKHKIQMRKANAHVCVMFAYVSSYPGHSHSIQVTELEHFLEEFLPHPKYL